MNHPAITQRQKLEFPAQPYVPEFAFLLNPTSTMDVK
jgi:hypothetical protein